MLFFCKTESSCHNDLFIHAQFICFLLEAGPSACMTSGLDGLERGRCLTLAWCQSKSFQREIVQSPWSLSVPPRREELGVWQVILSSVLSWATAELQFPVEGCLLFRWHHSMKKFSREKFRQTDLIEAGGGGGGIGLSVQSFLSDHFLGYSE